MFSIIVPNYNDSKGLKTCLKSIQDQDYEDFEVWIADNCSIDDSLAVAKPFEQDPRFTVLQNPTHTRNSVYGINQAMKQAKGEIAAWINSDDQMRPGYFKTLLPYFKDSSVGFVRTGIYAWFEDNRYSYKTFLPVPWKELIDIVVANKVFPGSPFRSKLFTAVGGMCEEMNFFDWDFWVRCALDGCGFQGWEYLDCNEALTIRKIHRSQDSTPETLKEGVNQILKKYIRDKNDTVI
jgi:glycosyltransferase involved in cell wall biosynthesis